MAVLALCSQWHLEQLECCQKSAMLHHHLITATAQQPYSDLSTPMHLSILSKKPYMAGLDLTGSTQENMILSWLVAVPISSCDLLCQQVYPNIPQATNYSVTIIPIIQLQAAGGHPINV